MCGRFVDPNLRSAGLDTNWLKIEPFASWTRRYNVKPTQDLIAFDPDLTPFLARWWLIPSWHRSELKEWKATTFNARIEEAREKPSFRGAWKTGRCIIPVGGYYEWTGKSPKKQPHFVQSAGNDETLYVAGLVSEWRDLKTSTMMTRAANESVSKVHHRMPVILDTAEQEAWLGGSDDLSIGSECQLKHKPVARFGLHDDGELLIED
jgi:putative SOS response-associated peptidase YedK